MQGVWSAARLLADQKEHRELWLAYRSTIFKRYLFAVANARDHVDITIAAGIALEDIETCEMRTFGQSVGSLENDGIQEN